MKVILDAEQIEKSLLGLTEEIADRASQGDDPVIIGVRSRGEILAQRLAAVFGAAGPADPLRNARHYAIP